MKTIGITGNIGSGKSYVAAIIEKMGYPVYKADKEANRLMQDPEVIMQLADRFGMDILTPDGLPDRKKIAALVFSNPDILQWLNRLIHPRVMQDWQKWLGKHATSPLCFMESAILFEHDLHQHFDFMVMVTAPEPMRIRRVMDRDGVDAASVQRRMEHQWPEEKKVAMADFVVMNDDHSMLLPQVVQLMNFLQKEPV
ncbi:MAG TPA: dephospho-CoA kinase [Bacteroidales bacterium]|nr:dephospho-CoA kinase [Bacteroidales bacterium]HRZ49319.1 dephospho-CoA kinase [Bacteroidales bacterium]